MTEFGTWHPRSGPSAWREARHKSPCEITRQAERHNSKVTRKVCDGQALFKGRRKDSPPSPKHNLKEGNSPSEANICAPKRSPYRYIYLYSVWKAGGEYCNSPIKHFYTTAEGIREMLYWFNYARAKSHQQIILVQNVHLEWAKQVQTHHNGRVEKLLS